MVAFGGAGPLHAIDLARELGMSRVTIPATPGTMCALGLLVSDLETELTRTRLMVLDPDSLPAANETWFEIDADAMSWVRRQDRPGPVKLVHRADLRYRGQDHSLTITVPAVPWDEEELSRVLAAFRAEHQDRNGYAAEDEAIEIENFRVVPSIGVSSAVTTGPAAVTDGATATPTEAEEITVWWSAESKQPTPVYRRDALAVGARIAGPALVLQEDATLVIPPRASAEVGADGSIGCLPWTSGVAGEPAGDAAMEVAL
jgi:N-methylhydantoinase A